MKTATWRFGLVVAALLNVAWKGALLMIGMAILLGMFLPGQAASTGGMGAPGSTRARVDDDGDRVRITMGTAEGDFATTFLLCDEAGRELVHVVYYKDGRVVFGSGEDSPVRAVVAPSRSGAVGWSLLHGRVVLGLEVRPDGSSVVDVSSPNNLHLDRLEVTPEGRPIHTISSPPVEVPAPG